VLVMSHPSTILALGSLTSEFSKGLEFKLVVIFLYAVGAPALGHFFGSA
jgi:hypothetical protein